MINPVFQKHLWADMPYIYIRHIDNEVNPDRCYEIFTSEDGRKKKYRLRGGNLMDATAVFMETAGRYAAYERKDGNNDIALIRRGYPIPPYVAQHFREIVHPMGTAMTDFRQVYGMELPIESSRSPSEWISLLEVRLLTGDIFFIIRDNTRYTVYCDVSIAMTRFALRKSWDMATSDYPLYFTESSLLYAAMISIAPIDQWQVKHVDWQAN